MFNFNLRRLTTTKWKGKRNPQTSYWRRASQIKTAQSQGRLFDFFSILFDSCKKCPVPYCSVLLAKRPWRTGTSISIQFFGKSIQTFKKSFYRKHFSFDVNLMLIRLTEQFEVVCLSEIGKTWIKLNSPYPKTNVVVSLCLIFEWTFLHGSSYFWLHENWARFN